MQPAGKRRPGKGGPGFNVEQGLAQAQANCPHQWKCMRCGAVHNPQPQAVNPRNFRNAGRGL